MGNTFDFKEIMTTLLKESEDTDRMEMVIGLFPADINDRRFLEDYDFVERNLGKLDEDDDLAQMKQKLEDWWDGLRGEHMLHIESPRFGWTHDVQVTVDYHPAHDPDEFLPTYAIYMDPGELHDLEEQHVAPEDIKDALLDELKYR